MTYKSLLTVAVDEKAAAPALDRAADLARKLDAHLEVLCLGIDRSQVGYTYYGGVNAMIEQEIVERAQEDARDLDAAVERRFTGDTLRWSSEAEIALLMDIGRAVGARARFSDLVVLPKPYAVSEGSEHEAVVEAALFEGGAPVLIVPPGTDLPVMPRRIGLAWNESDEALEAARRALPFLQAAEKVTIMIVDPPAHASDRSDPGGLLSQFLARHGVAVEIAVLAKGLPRVSEVLLRHASDNELEMIVMGAYGHSRFRQAILGGATRNMLEVAEIPVFMAH